MWESSIASIRPLVKDLSFNKICFTDSPPNTGLRVAIKDVPWLIVSQVPCHTAISWGRYARKLPIILVEEG